MEEILIPNQYTKVDNNNWEGSAVHSECALHQVSPFIGKVKSSMAKELLLKHSEFNSYIYDPFSGSSTIGLEGWILGRNVIVNDYSPYSHILNLGKLNPPESLEAALLEVEEISFKVKKLNLKIGLKGADRWVTDFFTPIPCLKF